MEKTDDHSDTVSSPKVYDLDAMASTMSDTDLNSNAIAASDLEPFYEMMVNLQRSIASIVDSPALNMGLTISKMVDDVVKMRYNTIGVILDNMPKITLPSSILFLPQLPPSDTTPKPKVELVGGSDLTVTDIVALPVKQKSRRQNKGFGLFFIVGNSVQYKRKTLKALSLETQHGQLLKMFVYAEGHFITDEKLLETFNKIIITDISHILRNLKNAFKYNNLKIIIERRKNSKGYVLVDIQELQ